MIRDAGLPVPEARVEVIVPGWGRARLENANPHLRVAVEYDGEADHSSMDDRERDDNRRAALTDAGWIILVLRKGDFTATRRAQWLGELAAVIAERTPVTAGKRIYSRGPDHPSYRWRRRR